MRRQDSNAARRCPPLVAFSGPIAGQVAEAKRFLRQHLYRHARVVEVTDAAKQVVRDLYRAYLADPANLPGNQASRQPHPQAIADYIAGMTDRFALREHARVFGQPPNSILTSMAPPLEPAT